MLRISDLTLARGTTRLFEGANLTLHAGHKAGLIGANGSGKTSLFAAIRGELSPDAGEIALPPKWTLAHVAQETAGGCNAGDRIRDGRRPRAS
jgi:ATP-binding cassette subfamily F protein 3